MNAQQLILFGDSITEGFNVRSHVPGRPIRNFGVSGDSTVECLERIVPSCFDPIPVRIFLCIGTNDLARNRTDEEILGNIRRIVQRIRELSPDVPIELTSLFPTRHNPPRPNERIRTFNGALNGLAAELRTGYFDLHPYFTDANGDLKQEFTEDGLHLTTAAYAQWAVILNSR